MNRNTETSLFPLYLVFSILIILLMFISSCARNEPTPISKTNTVSQESTEPKNQPNFVKCFGFNALKHGLYAKISVNGTFVKGTYVIDYGYSGNDCREYPFDGVLKKDVIDIQFGQKNPYEMSLGWELEGGESNLKASLKMVDDRLIHSRAFTTYKTEIGKGIESMDFMKEINCDKMPCRKDVR